MRYTDYEREQYKKFGVKALRPLDRVHTQEPIGTKYVGGTRNLSWTHDADILEKINRGESIKPL